MLCLVAGLLPALLGPTAVAQSTTNTPIFQFAIFYNMDLEISPGSAMTIIRPVWSNGGLWSGSTTVTFANTVSAVGIATNTANDPFCIGTPQYTGTGKAIYSMAGQPTSGNAPLTIAMIGTNNDPAAAEALINLPPANYAMGTAAAYSATGVVYSANAADLYLTNFPNGTNWGSRTPKGTNMILYYQDAANGPGNYLTRIPYDFNLLTNRVTHTIFSTNNVTSNQLTNLWYAGYSFATNAIFYDWREGWNGGSGIGGNGKAVQAVQIDIAKFNIWLTNTAVNNGGSTYNNTCQLSSHKSHPIDSIYIYNAVPLTSTTLPAVRVVNGAMLPSQTAPHGFTVVTPMPMYVWGNYNVSNSYGSSLGKNSTTYTWPAALMADSITILSTSWNDGITSKMPTASTITVNAACLAGIVRSTNSLYSGGVENYLRTLENWSGVSLWYNGSIVAMFPSRYATNYWQQPGGYYNAPVRKWAFDTNFLNLTKLPPLTPVVMDNSTNPPVITTQPQSQTAILGHTATFSITASGTWPLRYQWSFNGTNISGTTNSSLALSNIQTNQAGTYAVQLINLFGSTNSSNADLTVLVLPPSADVIFVAEEQLMRVSLVQSDGSIHSFANNVGLVYGLAADNVGNLYVSGTGDCTIRKVTPAGEVSGYASNCSALGDPTGLAFDAAGFLYSASSAYGTINKISPNGNISPFASGTSSPEALTFDANGNLYAANYGNNTISKITPSGAISTFASGLDHPWGLAFDQEGNLFVANYIGNTISTITPDGVVSLFATGLNRPTGLAFDSNGYLYVCSTGDHTLRIFTTNGVGFTFATGLNYPTAIIVEPAAKFPATTLTALSLSASNGFQFQVAGVPGFNYAVQESTNLIDWVSLITNTSPFIFVDANATNFPQQFYRTLFVP